MAKIRIFYTLLLLFFGTSVMLNAQEEAAEVSAASLYNDALEMLKAKDYEGAYPLLIQALEIADPEDETDAKVIDLTKKNGARAAYSLGTAALKGKDYEKALEYYGQGVEWLPSYYANVLGKAQALERLDKDQEAVVAYVTAGKLAAEGGKADRAESYFSKAAIIVGKTYAAKKYDDAIALADAYLELHPDMHDVHYYLGSSLLDKGDAAKALAELDKAIEMASDESDELSKYFYKKGQAHEKLGQKSDAIAAYGKVTDPKYKEAADYQINQLNNR